MESGDKEGRCHHAGGDWAGRGLWLPREQVRQRRQTQSRLGLRIHLAASNNIARSKHRLLPPLLRHPSHPPSPLFVDSVNSRRPYLAFDPSFHILLGFGFTPNRDNPRVQAEGSVTLTWSLLSSSQRWILHRGGIMDMLSFSSSSGHSFHL